MVSCRTISLVCVPLFVTVLGCLYSEGIGPAPTENSPPYFYNWIPAETSSVVDENGTTFYVFYTDPDEEDIERLEMEWFLNGRAQGNGNQVKIWLEDLGQDRTAVLVANVQDPQGAQDSLLWRLEADTQISEGE